MPRTELGRVSPERPPPGSVNEPGEEYGTPDLPRETVLDRVPVFEGAKGDPGDKGDKGEKGDDGVDAIPAFHYTAPDPALSVWSIPHGRGGYPVVVLRDPSNRLMFAQVAYQSADEVVVSFPSPQLGTAELIF